MKPAKLWIIFFLLLLFLFLSKTPTFAGDITFNELMIHPSSGSDWIELYNTNSSLIPLDGWKIIDTTSTVVTLSGSIDGNGFKVLEVSNRLNNGGDTITLKDQSDGQVDTYSYSSDPGIDIPIGRQPDGTGTWATLSQSTKGSSNGGSSLVPTATSTPLPTPSPTNTPTPTKTPTPTPIKTPTPTPKSVSGGGSSSTSTPKPTSPPTSVPTKILALSSQAAGGSGNINTAVSPAVISSPTSTKGPTKKPTPTKTTAILGVAQSNISKILIGAGLIFLLACGILAFRNFKREKIS